MEQVKLEKIVAEIGVVIRKKEYELTGGEYVTVLHNLIAQVLAANPKALEKDFFEKLRRDVLRRRLERLRAEASELGGELPIAEGGVE